MNLNNTNDDQHPLHGSDWMTLPFYLKPGADPYTQSAQVHTYMIDVMSKSAVILGFGNEAFSQLASRSREIAEAFGAPNTILMENMASVMATLADKEVDPIFFTSAAGPVSCGCIVESGLYHAHHKPERKANHWIILGYRLYDSSYCCRLAHLGYGEKVLSAEEIDRFTRGIVDYDIKLSLGEAQPTSLRAHVGTALRRGGGPILHPDFFNPR